MTDMRYKGVPARDTSEKLAADEAAASMKALDGWSREDEAIVKIFHFADYHQTLAFVNAVAWIAHRADHHPELVVGYNSCKVSYTTHSAGGLSRKDFTSAARVDRLLSE
jgi:4a-hydroxytetrahydrobiopterin dehydratase